MYFTRSVPTGAFRNRFKDAVDQWEAVHQRVAFSVYADTAPRFPPGQTGADNDCRRTAYEGQRISLVTYLGIDGPGGYAAINLTCNVDTSSGRRADYFYMYIDSEEPWYMGTRDAPRGSVDLWSTLSHEMGHATGWGPHLNDAAYTALCDDNSEQHTMCASVKDGTERIRTLAPHDKDTYRNAYP